MLHHAVRAVPGVKLKGKKDNFVISNDGSRPKDQCAPIYSMYVYRSELVSVCKNSEQVIIQSLQYLASSCFIKCYSGDETNLESPTAAPSKKHPGWMLLHFGP